MNAKTLSFVIPAYNSAKFLDKCLQSMIIPEILDQLEIIVVNDGSTDSTAEIAGSYSARYPDTIRLISQPNKGHGGALNTGCAEAKGRYLKVIDADDWVNSDSLPQFLSCLRDCTSDVVLTHHHTIDIGTGEIKSWRSFPEQFAREYSFPEIMTNWKSFDRSLTFHGITYRTAFYQSWKHPLPEHIFYEDHLYATYPCCCAAGVMPLDLFIYEYRIGDVSQSVSGQNQLKRIGHTEKVLEEMILQYQELQASSGKDYAKWKIHGLLMSYLTTALLVDQDRKHGRQLAYHEMEFCRREVPEVYELTRKKYQVFQLMNRLQMTKAAWDRILASPLYNKIRHNHSFE